MYLTAVKTLFGILDLLVIFLRIEGWIGSIKRLVQVTNLNPHSPLKINNEVASPERAKGIRVAGTFTFLCLRVLVAEKEMPQSH